MTSPNYKQDVKKWLDDIFQEAKEPDTSPYLGLDPPVMCHRCCGKGKLPLSKDPCRLCEGTVELTRKKLWERYFNEKTRR